MRLRNADRVAPFHIRITGLDGLRQLCDGLSENSEVPEERVATVAVGVEVRRCALGGQLDEALGCVDDLDEQEAVTLHTACAPRPGRHLG